MKRATLAALTLLPLAACGGGGDEDEPAAKPSPTAEVSKAVETPTADAETCEKLARTWAVAANSLKSGLLLMVADVAEERTTAMHAATDQMEIEQCKSRAHDAALEGNYHAALANAQMTICMNNGVDYCDKAADTWERGGEPLVEEVRALTHME